MRYMDDRPQMPPTEESRVRDQRQFRSNMVVRGCLVVVAVLVVGGAIAIITAVPRGMERVTDEAILKVAGNAGAREGVSAIASVTGQMSEEQLRRKYDEYLVATKSAGSLGVGAGPKSFEEFGKEYENRGQLMLNELDWSARRIHWKRADKAAFFKWCYDRGYIKHGDYSRYISDLQNRYSGTQSLDPPDELSKRFDEYLGR
jgi:hypothetical protein